MAHYRGDRRRDRQMERLSILGRLIKGKQSIGHCYISSLSLSHTHAHTHIHTQHTPSCCSRRLCNRNQERSEPSEPTRTRTLLQIHVLKWKKWCSHQIFVTEHVQKQQAGVCKGHQRRLRSGSVLFWREDKSRANGPTAFYGNHRQTSCTRSHLQEAGTWSSGYWIIHWSSNLKEWNEFKKIKRAE